MIETFDYCAAKPTNPLLIQSDEFKYDVEPEYDTFVRFIEPCREIPPTTPDKVILVPSAY